ncbi:MAG: tetratricopeptide repeat protein [Mangrovicoccus sp.]|nr:tetratricopeptide repeat protein [Mangrovicoccus sp.]
MIAPNRRAQAMLDSGMGKRVAGDLPGAIARFDNLIAYCPDFAEGYHQRAIARYLQHDYDAALEDIHAALQRAPDHASALAGKGRVLMAMGDYAAARAALRSALTLNPWLPERGLLQSPPGEAV